MPRATLSMAKVVMKDWRLKRVVTQPFTRPTVPVTASVSATAGRCPGQAASWPLAATTAPRAMTAPTEKIDAGDQDDHGHADGDDAVHGREPNDVEQVRGCRKTMFPSRVGEATAARTRMTRRMIQP